VSSTFFQKASILISPVATIDYMSWHLLFDGDVFCWIMAIGMSDVLPDKVPKARLDKVDVLLTRHEVRR
jgi:hypothetical protein